MPKNPDDRAAARVAPGAREELRVPSDAGEAASDDAMTRYALLLRGVNVGASNSLPIAERRAILTKLGCTDVETTCGAATPCSARRSARPPSRRRSRKRSSSTWAADRHDAPNAEPDEGNSRRQPLRERGHGLRVPVRNVLGEHADQVGAGVPLQTRGPVATGASGPQRLCHLARGSSAMRMILPDAASSKRKYVLKSPQRSEWKAPISSRPSSLNGGEAFVSERVPRELFQAARAAVVEELGVPLELRRPTGPVAGLERIDRCLDDRVLQHLDHREILSLPDPALFQHPIRVVHAKRQITLELHTGSTPERRRSDKFVPSEPHMRRRHRTLTGHITGDDYAEAEVRGAASSGCRYVYCQPPILPRWRRDRWNRRRGGCGRCHGAERGCRSAWNS